MSSRQEDIQMKIKSHRKEINRHDLAEQTQRNAILHGIFDMLGEIALQLAELNEREEKKQGRTSQKTR
jgi:hypothetical protein